MQFSIMIRLAFVALVSVAFGSAIHAATPGTALPWPAVDLQFKGTVSGKAVALSGTAQSIIAQLKVQHPEFSPNLTAPGSFPHGAPIHGASPRSELVTRQKTTQNCIPNDPYGWSTAIGWAILTDINFLNALPGFCGVAGKSCTRIACTSESAIWWCNDAPWDQWVNCGLDGSDGLAGYADDLYLDCGVVDPLSGTWLCGGQEFSATGWNIIVRWDSSDGC